MRERWLVLACALAAACGRNNDVAPPADLSVAPPAMKSKVDVLFVLGNEASTAPYRAELRSRFPQLLQILTDTGKTHPASYHFGVVTADLGIGATIGGGACHPGGDGAKLQAIGRAADATCQPLSGVSFIDYDQIAQTNNLPAGQDLATTFGCVESVAEGCGFQQPLEAAWRALHDPIPENAGFLRDDALLVVVFLVDKDDCSSLPDTDLGSDSPAAMMAYGPLTSFRCLEVGVQCGDPGQPIQPVASNGPLRLCRQLTVAQGGKLIDVQKYFDYFTLPAAMGGVKADPRDVMVAAIAPPEAPFAITAISSCTPSANQVCVWPAPSCVSSTNSAFFGDPAVRVRALMSGLSSVNPLNAQTTSSCDTSYQQALQGIGDLIVSRVD
jgi:hypothetical protein